MSRVDPQLRLPPPERTAQTEPAQRTARPGGTVPNPPVGGLPGVGLKTQSRPEATPVPPVQPSVILPETPVGHAAEMPFAPAVRIEAFLPHAAASDNVAAALPLGEPLLQALPPEQTISRQTTEIIKNDTFAASQTIIGHIGGLNPEDNGQRDPPSGGDFGPPGAQQPGAQDSDQMADVWAARDLLARRAQQRLALTDAMPDGPGEKSGPEAVLANLAALAGDADWAALWGLGHPMAQIVDAGAPSAGLPAAAALTADEMPNGGQVAADIALLPPALDGTGVRLDNSLGILPRAWARSFARAAAAAESQARMGAQHAAWMLQALATSHQPLVALVWSDIFRLQQARIDELASRRGSDDDGEMLPVNADEALRRRRRIQEVDLSMLDGRRLHDDPWEQMTLEDPQAAADVYFRAVLLATALQRPQVVTRMFRSAAQSAQVRFYRRVRASRFLEQWHDLAGDKVLPTSILPALHGKMDALLSGALQEQKPGHPPLQSWMQAAEHTFLQTLQHTNYRTHAASHERCERAFELIHGRAAWSLPVASTDEAVIRRLIGRTNTPHDEPWVAVTHQAAEAALLPQHAYAILGTFRQQKHFMVALADPMAAAGPGILAVPFGSLMHSSASLSTIKQAPRRA